MKPAYANKKILITGGSSGIGLALAKQLAQQGAVVWLLARDRQKLAAAWDEVRAHLPAPAAPAEAQILAADVADGAALTTVLADWMHTHGAPDVLINSAGITHPGLVEELDVEHFRRLMDVNYFGTVYSTKALLPAMLQRGSGHIINVSSVAGFLGVFGYAAYGPSKFAVRGFSDVLRSEMLGRGIRVSVVFPPDTQTPQLDYEAAYKPAVLKILNETNTVMTADAVAAVILKQAARGRYIITPGAEATLFFHLSNLLGPLTYRVMDFMVAGARRRIQRERTAHHGRQ